MPNSKTKINSGKDTSDIRHKTIRVKSAKRRKISSTRWLKRQLNDPYVREARIRGYRSRAAIKLIQLDDKFNFLRKGHRVIDLGAAPGGWTQVAVERCTGGKIIGVDILDMEIVAGACILTGDFLSETFREEVKKNLDEKANVVLTDMAASSSGHPSTDHLRIITMLESAIDFAIDILAKRGTFVGKVLQGGTENKLLSVLKNNFSTVHHYKPPASRKESSEMYVVAKNFK